MNKKKCSHIEQNYDVKKNKLACRSCGKDLGKANNKLPERLDYIEVKWIDAQTGFGELKEIQEFTEEFEPLVTTTVGILIDNNLKKDYIIVGFLMMSDKIEETSGIKYWQLIPRGMIQTITKLRNYEDTHNKNEVRRDE